MLEWAITSSVLILVVLAVRRLLMGKISLRLQYGLWALVLLRLLVPVSLGETAWSVLNLAEFVLPAEECSPMGKSEGVDQMTPELSIIEPDDTLGPQLSVVAPDTSFSSELPQIESVAAEGTEFQARNTVEQKLTALWAAGAAGLGLWLLWVNVRFGRKLCRSRRPLEVENCPLSVYVTGTTQTPCLFGLLRPTIYVTEEVTADKTILRHSLVHELTHYCHRDHIWAALRGLCLALHWYNPLVWMAAAVSQRDGELCCDEATVNRLGEGERGSYGRTLLAVTCQGRGTPLLTATNMTDSKRGIKERILLLTKHPRTAFCSLMGVILIMTITVGCTFTNSNSSSSNEENISEEIEGNLAWVDGIIISGLAPEEEKISSEDIIISTDESEFRYTFTYSHSGVTLEFGLRGTDGTEYTQTVTGGSIVGSFKDVSVGTYQLFVRNSEKLSEIPNYQENSEAYLVNGVINLYRVDEASSGESSASGFALGYPGASLELNPINWTFSQADVPILINTLNCSNYLALYMDQDLFLRVTSDRKIEISYDSGLTWSAETYETISKEDFSTWLLKNEPLPNFSMSDLRERLNNGAEVRHMVLDQGKEIYFVLDDYGALMELVQEEKIQALLLDGQRLVLTSTSSQPFLLSKSMFDSFQDLLNTCNVINSSESEKEWSDVIAHLNECGAKFS